MALRIFKFGGASVKDANGVRNVCNIILHNPDVFVVVVSAMGKTTNALENLLSAYLEGKKEQVEAIYEQVIEYHKDIVKKLFPEQHGFSNAVRGIIDSLCDKLISDPGEDYDYEYDQIVSYGELLSTQIVSEYALSVGLKNYWVDIRHVLKTDNNYRDAGINWGLSSQFIHKTFNRDKNTLYITQGFIGSTISNDTTTLGREGSDYSGAVLAYILGADSLSIWKDVPGVLNADPRWYPHAQKIKELSYPEAIELAFYGAQIIHPKTLKPLQNKNIPLYVKSFLDENIEGTVIQKTKNQAGSVPIFILKSNQIFLTISPKDFSFILEDNLSAIFAVFSKCRIKINLMQNSALNFSACVNSTREIDTLLALLHGNYMVRYNDNLELVTIRNYTDDAIRMITRDKEIVDSQLSRKTARFVLRTSEWKFD